MPQPTFATFRVDVTATGLRFLRQSVGDGSAVFSSVVGDGTPQHLTLEARYRASDDRSVVILDGATLAATSSLFDPSWRGVETWLAFGLFNEAERSYASPEPSRAPEAASAQAPGPRESGLAVIGHLHAVSSRAYVVADAGPEACALGGASGERIALAARGDANAHPLTGAVIDPAGRFCVLRFALRGTSAYASDGTFELDFAQSDGYWIVRRGAIAYSLHAPGRRPRSASVVFAYDALAFPASLPDADFSMTTPSAGAR